MKKLRLISIGVIIAAIAVTIGFVKQRRERREIDATEFEAMRKNPWDLNGDLLWSYFFTNEAKWPLEFDAQVLRIVGYKTVDIYHDETKDFWWLHVERVERLTLDSMAGRNVRLTWLGKLFGGSVYDGWDVGQVGRTPKKANQTPEPTAMLGAPRASARGAPSTAVSHL